MGLVVMKNDGKVMLSEQGTEIELLTLSQLVFGAVYAIKEARMFEEEVSYNHAYENKKEVIKHTYIICDAQNMYLVQRQFTPRFHMEAQFDPYTTIGFTFSNSRPNDATRQILSVSQLTREALVPDETYLYREYSFYTSLVHKNKIEIDEANDKGEIFRIYCSFQSNLNVDLKWTYDSRCFIVSAFLEVSDEYGVVLATLDGWNLITKLLPLTEKQRNGIEQLALEYGAIKYSQFKGCRVRSEKASEPAGEAAFKEKQNALLDCTLDTLFEKAKTIGSR
ncbi:hypothetical protein INT47_008029 [Mucor saturninus]|uniref:Uncharacterized protein n=1 Tax=Mucor saturninus TaxID=64648 RepID=A0A8H7V6Y2_9FUNG|nr:hypothetical protein INT47_008029 [Mucor saturninus]